MKEKTKLILIIAAFLAAFYVPFQKISIQQSILESFIMLQLYAREHVILCLIPAFFIAGAIAVFIRQQSVIKYFGSTANKFLSYAIASISGTILAVCSCTVLPLFSGIYKRGAGLGPAVAFLYSGPAINVMAIILTARVLGIRLGIARALGAILFAVVIGILMQLLFRNDEKHRAKDIQFIQEDSTKEKSPTKIIIYFSLMVGILIFANWGADDSIAIWNKIHQLKWWITSFLFMILIYVLVQWFRKQELKVWVSSSWNFAKQILPLLAIGVLLAGFLLGRPGHQALIPPGWIEQLVGGNSLRANFIASIVGAFMYFATLTEVPILQGLLGTGMGQGPALALLLAGPALSLPNMLVIKSVIGTRKTIIYIILVMIMATLSGVIYGSLF